MKDYCGVGSSRPPNRVYLPQISREDFEDFHLQRMPDYGEPSSSVPPQSQF